MICSVKRPLNKLAYCVLNRIAFPFSIYNYSRPIFQLHGEKRRAGPVNPQMEPLSSSLDPVLLEISSSHFYTLTVSISMSRFLIEDENKRFRIIVVNG